MMTLKRSCVSSSRWLGRVCSVSARVSHCSHQRRLASTGDVPFDKVLIANRGEIACRVIRTCQRLGVRTVALYSNVDGPNALHASMADEAYRIGDGPSAADSYLRGDEVIDIARKSGAQAIHPGYGFLSENTNFCQKVSDSFLTFIGPPPDAILAMGSKSHSKEIMEEANVPTTPGYHGSDQDPDVLQEEAVKIGFPLLIKATMGGGGKGMRLVWKESEFPEALESCRRESQSAFGDSRVILEKYLVHPRHVEVQVVADKHGNVLHLFERDCSLQRRHQKIIEEAPASDLPDDLRRQMGEMGKIAAKAVGYVNAGTVEFLLDTQSPEGKFYFCEMNTRLQVEHPITELITGIDLVEWQLRVAAGEPLPITNQEELECMGHAMEARIYAENPARDFLPATGRLWHHHTPAEPNAGISHAGVRVDTGIRAGDDISVYYDPMISKLIVHGKDREDARKKLVSSLKSYQIAGVPNNISFLIQCAQHPTFATAGAVNTGFLEKHGSDISVDNGPVSALSRAIGAFAIMLHYECRIGVDVAASRTCGTPWSQFMGSWRMGDEHGRVKRSLTVTESDEPIECWSNRDGSFDIRLPDAGDTVSISGSLDVDHQMKVTVNGSKRMSFSAVVQEDEEAGTIEVKLWPTKITRREIENAWELSVYHPLISLASKAGRGSAGSGTLKAPMPGTVIRVNVSEGDQVEEGDVVIVMEAMKMEHAIKAAARGVASSIGCSVGDIVEDGAILAVVEDSTPT